MRPADGWAVVGAVALAALCSAIAPHVAPAARTAHPQTVKTRAGKQVGGVRERARGTGRSVAGPAAAAACSCCAATRLPRCRHACMRPPCAMRPAAPLTDGLLLVGLAVGEAGGLAGLAAKQARQVGALGGSAQGGGGEGGGWVASGWPGGRLGTARVRAAARVTDVRRRKLPGGGCWRQHSGRRVAAASLAWQARVWECRALLRRWLAPRLTAAFGPAPLRHHCTWGGGLATRSAATADDHLLVAGALLDRVALGAL